MTLIEAIVLAAFATFILLFTFLLINAIHFYCVHHDELSKKIDGRLFDGGFLFSASRFMLWGHYCVSEKKAENSGVKEIFAELPRSARRQLIFHWYGMMYCGVVLIGFGMWMLFEK